MHIPPIRNKVISHLMLVNILAPYLPYGSKGLQFFISLVSYLWRIKYHPIIYMQFFQRASFAMIGHHKATLNATFDVVFGNYRYPISFCAIHTTKKMQINDNPMSAGNVLY